MTTELERSADKARREPTLQFTSLVHHLTPARRWQALHQMNRDTASGVDGVAHDGAVDTFPLWSREGPRCNCVDNNQQRFGPVAYADWRMRS